MMSLAVAIGQFAPTEDKGANIATIDRMVREAAGRGARLLVLPEYSLFTAPAMDDRFVDSAESLDGATVSQLRSLSSEMGVSMIVGVNEAASEGQIYNTLIGIQHGKVQAVYRKVHLYDAFGFRESECVLAADPSEPQLLEVDGYTVGMQTCYDLRFPETSRMLVDAGSDVIALPAEWVPGPLKEYHWNTLIRARAIENTVYVVAAGQSGPTGSGNSAVIDPMGIPLVALGETPGVTTAVVEH